MWTEGVVHSRYTELAAHAALVLLAVARSLLDSRLGAQAAAFETGGGFTERLYRALRKTLIALFVYPVHQVRPVHLGLKSLCNLFAVSLLWYS